MTTESKLTAKELSVMANRRQWRKIIKAWKFGDVVASDPHALYQVFLAYSMVGWRVTADWVRQSLPESMQYDAQRDVILAMIRKPRISPDRLTWLFHLTEKLVQEARTSGDINRLAVAEMTKSRLLWRKGEVDKAQQQIQDAFNTILGVEQSLVNDTWRRNIAFWYLLYGARDLRQQALDYVKRDPNLGRRAVGRISLSSPSLGRTVERILSRLERAFRVLM